jgi:mono/diheme cytochrome c family protein
MRTLCLVALSAVALAAFGCAKPIPTPAPPRAAAPTPAPPAAAPPSAAAQAGLELVQKEKCRHCHVIAGAGVKHGPELAGLEQTRQWIVEKLRNPVSKTASGKSEMPPFSRLSQQQLEQIADYLLSLK